MANHLGQVEALRKVKGKGKKVFSRPPCKDSLVGRGEQALLSKSTNQGILGSNSQEAAAHGEMTITYRAKGSQCIVVEPKAQLSVMFSTQNAGVNCEPYNAKIACCGFFLGTKSSGQSTGSGKNFPVCHQLEGDNGGSVGPADSTGVSHPFQGRTSPSAPSSTLPVFGRSDESFMPGSDLIIKERSSGDSGSFRVGERVLFDPFLSSHRQCSLLCFIDTCRETCRRPWPGAIRATSLHSNSPRHLVRKFNGGRSIPLTLWNG